MSKIFFNTRIKYLRQKHNLTQESFGALFGISKAAISDIELGRRDVMTTIPKLVAIANHFDVSTDWLLGRTDNVHSHHG